PYKPYIIPMLQRSWRLNGPCSSYLAAVVTCRWAVTAVKLITHSRYSPQRQLTAMNFPTDYFWKQPQPRALPKAFILITMRTASFRKRFLYHATLTSKAIFIKR